MRKSSVSSIKKRTPSKISQSKCTIKSSKKSEQPQARSTRKEKSADRNKKIKNKKKDKNKCICQAQQKLSKYSAIKKNVDYQDNEQMLKKNHKNNKIHIDDVYNEKSSQSEDSLQYVIQADQKFRSKQKKIEEKSGRKIKFKQSSKKILKNEQQLYKKIKGNSESKDSILKSFKSRKNSADLIKQITHSNISKMIDREQLSLFLDDYERTLNQRLKLLKSKWGQLQILQKSVNNYTNQENNSSNTLVIQNEFYVQKITDLQSQLKQKNTEIKQLKSKQNEPNNEKQIEAVRQNKRLKQENSLLERQNKILKNKLKELGFL